MLNNFINKIVGSNLTKNYDVDKEPYMHGGLHNLWKIYRAKKKDRNNMDCSLFIFDKKSLDKKKLSQNQRDEIYNILKKDPQNLAKLRHPNLLSLVEQFQEDQKFIVFATEPVEFNLTSLMFDASKKDQIPGDLEIKVLSLELLEALNFLHNNAKTMHMNLAPENFYITKDGKLKLGGLNFAQQFSTAETLSVPLNFDLKINEVAAVPNLRFSPLEISDKLQCSLNTDLFSVGCLIYYMVALNKGKDPFLLNQANITDKSAHGFEIQALDRKFNQIMQSLDSDLEHLLRQLLNTHDPQARGPLNTIVEKSWFQDPLLKTIKYLETLDSKDHQNKVQFMTGITRILEKFDKKALLKKVIPLLLDQMKMIQLSVSVLPNILDVMERPDYLTISEFREYIWPSLQKLCKAKELPAQSLYLILKNTELFMKFVGPTEFQSHFLILINKSLECGVPKLQFLALTKVPIMVKQLEYMVVKQQILPRVLMIIEKPSQLQLKQKTLEILNEIIGGIDQQTMKDKILKTFEKIRSTETDPQVCMLLLKVYEQMAKVLGVEEIGLKILPGIIPMLISGTFTKTQFTEMISSVRRLLDQIEKHKEKDLRDMGQDLQQSDKLDIEEKPRSAPIQNPTNKDVFDFLNSLADKEHSANPQDNRNSNPQSNTNPQSLMAGLNLGNTNPFANGADPFAEIISNKNTAPPKTQLGGSGWDNDIHIPEIIGKSGSQQQQQMKSSVGTDDFFNNFTQKTNNPPLQTNDWASFGQTNPSQTQSSNAKQSFNTAFQSSTGVGFGSSSGNNNTGLGNLNFSSSKIGGGSGFGGSKSEDPFAELINEHSSTANNFNMNIGGNFGQQNPSSMNFQTQSTGFGQSLLNNKINLKQLSYQSQQQQPPSFGSQMNTNFGSSNFNQQNTSNLNFGNPNFGNNQGSGNYNNGGGFGGSGFGQNQNNFGNFGNQNNMNLNNSGLNNNSNPLTGLNFGMPTNNMNNSNNLGFNAFGGQQQQQTNQIKLNDDFFSQFTSSTNQQKNNSNFNGF